MIPLMKNAFLNEQETKKALSEFILNATQLSMGEKCVEFERAFAKKQGSADAVLFNSGGSANLAMIQALKNLGKLKDGDRVGFSALTWSTNTMPIIQMGMIPVAIDCDVNTMNVSSDILIAALEEQEMEALFITNVLGFAGDLAKIKEVCAERNVILIEDNCESLGTIVDNDKTGNFGLGASFSFFVAHHMSTIEGGMVCTNDEEYAEMLRIVRANGWDRNLSDQQKKKWRTQYNIESEFQAKYTFYDLGYNLRPTEITGFIGLFQLKFLEENIKTRVANFQLLEEVIKQNDDLVSLNRDHIELLSSFAIPIVCKTPELRNQYVSKFMEAGIEIRPLIAGNMQKQPFYHKYVDKMFDLPNTDFLHECSFYCGNYPELTPADLEVISNCLSKSVLAV